jgi:arylsulfatase
MKAAYAMSRKRLLVFSKVQGRMNKKPNIIVITTDQQRYDSIRLHGSNFMNTPNMDRLGQEGVSFCRASLHPTMEKC